MPRKARKFIDFPGTLYHIVVRGNNQRRIFRRGRDYKKFLKILKQVKREYPFYLYAYNLLPNHFHLIIERRRISISKIMGRINSLYAQYFNRYYKRSGHLFQGRFYSSVIDKEKYFWAAARYVDLNAVRAGLVKRPEDYPWSSYLVYYQKYYNGDLIDRERFLGYVEGDIEEARLKYLEFVQEGIDADATENLGFTKDKNMI